MHEVQTECSNQLKSIDSAMINIEPQSVLFHKYDFTGRSETMSAVLDCAFLVMTVSKVE